MKKILFMLIALAAIASPQAAKAVDFEGFYAGGLGGLNFLSHSKAHFKTGWTAGAFIGHRWCEGFRLEGEAVYRRNNVRSHNRHYNRYVQAWSFMANGYYEIPVCFCITPYLGAGIGYDTTNSKSCRGGSSGSSSGHRKNHNNGFAWQVIAGGLYPVDECLEVGLEYRYHQGRPTTLHNNIVDVRINWFF